MLAMSACCAFSMMGRRLRWWYAIMVCVYKGQPRHLNTMMAIGLSRPVPTACSPPSLLTRRSSRGGRPARSPASGGCAP